jgi:apolipoprotein D and lipocalin family protein
VLSLACGACWRAPAPLPELRTAPRVDLRRYTGTWFEIASFPTWFQRGCYATRATYTLRADGDIDVRNECRQGALDGPPTVATGTAWVVDKTTNAKLEVQFFWPFRGDYWILEVDPNYQYAVVGHPSREYLWVLARRPSMDAATYERLVAGLAAQGYKVDRLQKTVQESEAASAAH